MKSISLILAAGLLCITGLGGSVHAKDSGTKKSAEVKATAAPAKAAPGKVASGKAASAPAALVGGTVTGTAAGTAAGGTATPEPAHAKVCQGTTRCRIWCQNPPGGAADFSIGGSQSLVSGSPPNCVYSTTCNATCPKGSTQL